MPVADPRRQRRRRDGALVVDISGDLESGEGGAPSGTELKDTPLLVDMYTLPSVLAAKSALALTYFKELAWPVKPVAATKLPLLKTPTSVPMK
jgi:hypothetical protein